MLTLTDVYAGYGGGDVLQGVDLEVARGTIACIVGPNGAGKSTVLRAVSGLLRPREGEIRLEGSRLDGLSTAEVLREGVAQVPQSNALFPNISVRENVLMGAYIERDPALAPLRSEPGWQPLIDRVRHEQERAAESFVRAGGAALLGVWRRKS